VGAGAVVTSDVPPDTIAVGNPAEVLREVDASRDKNIRARVGELEEALMTGGGDSSGRRRAAALATVKFFGLQGH
jgi:hypothetical protein